MVDRWRVGAGNGSVFWIQQVRSSILLSCSKIPTENAEDFARDVGEDILAAPQRALSGRIRRLTLQMRMREQRKYQTEWLREHAGQAEGRRVFQWFFRGQPLAEAADSWSAMSVKPFHLPKTQTTRQPNFGMIGMNPAETSEVGRCGVEDQSLFHWDEPSGDRRPSPELVFN